MRTIVFDATLVHVDGLERWLFTPRSLNEEGPLERIRQKFETIINESGGGDGLLVVDIGDESVMGGFPAKADLFHCVETIHGTRLI